MKRVRVVTDLVECRELWKQLIPQEQLSDLWEVRDCFQRQYGHKPYFVVCEDESGVCGFLPLSRNQETGSYVYFPGETWSSKTWLEQNRLIVRDSSVLKYMLSLVTGPYYLRYLQPNEWTVGLGQTVDEIGFYFLPPHYDYDINQYYLEFSGKSVKRLKREIESFESRGVEYVYNEESDFETMVALNLKRYGVSSYFSDPRFLRSFRSLLHLLTARDRLRLTKVVIAGKVAAVDMGCVLNGTYTLLAGGTHPDFPGVAKLINLYHMKWACEQRIDRVDFLCGDFNWKTQFHLTPRPLYLLTGQGGLVDHRERSIGRPWHLPRIGLTAGSVNHV